MLVELSWGLGGELHIVYCNQSSHSCDCNIPIKFTYLLTYELYYIYFNSRLVAHDNTTYTQ